MKSMKIATGVFLFGSLFLTGQHVLAADQLPANRVTDAQVTFVEDNLPTNPTNPNFPDPENPVKPVDPTNPTKPVEPGTNGPLSLDFASVLDFGEQLISLEDQNYFAKPQYLFAEDGTIDKENPVPNYVQITDKRGGEKGWSLSVKQNGPFTSVKNKKELTGAELIFTNGEADSISNSKDPSVVKPLFGLVPDGSGASETIMAAAPGEGFGTWVYRFGDELTKDSSIMLFVPGTTVKEADTYKTSLTWTLTDTPANK